MEEQISDEGANKKIRHRKKQLFNSILEQIEFYFSDSNLNKDRFLAQLIQTDPYVDLSIFLKFNKIRSLTTNIEDICKALRKSEKLQLSEDNQKVCRVTPVQEKINLDECTIYVERLPADVEHEWLKNIFSKFGTVDYVSIPKYKHNKMIKGFAFIEYSEPDEAQKVLDYFESIGCKLPTKMPPEQLISIATFEPDNTNGHIYSQNNFVEKENKDELNEGIKINDDVSTTNDTNEKSMEKESKTSENLEIDCETKKRKLSENEDEDTKKKLKNDSDINVKEVGSNNDEKAENNQEENVDKKRRKRKKSHKKNTYDIKQIGLKVLSKKEWKQLRNKYLNLQRNKMQNLKEHLNRTRFVNNSHYAENTASDRNSSKPQREEAEPAPRFTYTPGTIIHFELPEECTDLKKFKANVKTHTGVEFVDITIGSHQGYIRFANSESAEKFLESSMDASKQILQGDEEKQYWDKIIQDREMKMKKEVGKKQRGRDKLLRKAEKALGKHIRFDNAE